MRLTCLSNYFPESSNLQKVTLGQRLYRVWKKIVADNSVSQIRVHIYLLIVFFPCPYWGLNYSSLPVLGLIIFIYYSCSGEYHIWHDVNLQHWPLPGLFHKKQISELTWYIQDTRSLCCDPLIITKQPLLSINNHT